nr:NADH dehydrogenase subunit 3 [Kradibia gibbosae]
MMMIMLIMLLFFFIMFFMMLMMSFILNKKMFKNYEKMTPFECGFMPLSDDRLPFSLQFYMISTIFLIFDVEISLILPMIGSLNMMMFEYYYIMMLIFLILLIGLFLEWKEGALSWFK